MKEFIDLSNQFKPRGKIKVELMDSSGKVIDKQETENFIAKAVMEGLFTNAMRDIFTNSRHTGGHTLSSHFQDPFHSMDLTNATHPESPDTEFFRAGNLIGYAYTTGTYTGTDTLRGSYNPSESFTNREQVHIVVDFPTHAGNGTFQSIYFTASHSSITSTSTYHFKDQLYYKVIKHNDEIYGFANSSTNSNLYILNDDFDVEEEISLGRSYYDFCIVGNTIYFIYNGEVYSAPINDPSNYSSVTTLDNNGRGIGYDSKTGRWFVLYGTTLYMYDSNWDLLSTYNNSSGSTFNKITAVVDDGVILSNGTFIWIGGDYDGEEVPLHDSNPSDYYLSGIADGYLFYSYYRSSSDRYFFRTPFVNIGSRALLDSPVTKTSNNTMKITYDFMLPPL